MKKFIELQTYVYKVKDFNKYMNSQLPEDEEADEIESLVKQSLAGETPLPVPQLARIFINPEHIISYSESYSLEEAHNNPEEPLMDSTEVNLIEGISYNLNCTINEFQEKLREFYATI